MPKPITPRTTSLRHSSQEASLNDMLSDIVDEYTRKISELASLTSELHDRLRISNGCGTHSKGLCDRTPRIATSNSKKKPCTSSAVPALREHESDILDYEIPCTPGRSNVDMKECFANVVSDMPDANVSFPTKAVDARECPSVTSKGTRTTKYTQASVFGYIGDIISPFHTSSNIHRSELYQLAMHVCSCFHKPSSRSLSRVQQEDLKEHAEDIEFTLFGASAKFDLLIGFLILANCVTMMIHLEYVGYLSQISLGQIEDDGSWKGASFWFRFCEHLFNALFIVEMLIRFGILGRSMFKDKTIAFDVVLVFGNSIQVYLLEPLTDSGSEVAKLSLFRLLRFVRFIRIFRLVRVLKLFSELRVLVKTVISSFGALVWSMILLMVIMTMAGLFLSEMLKEFITDPSRDMTQRKWVFKHYGTATRAMYTLFEVTLAGCWPNYFRPLIDHVSGWYIMFAVVYISFVVFAIIRIITAIFLKETLQIASNDAEMMVHERLKQKEIYVKKLAGVFKAVDKSGDGKLTLEEFGAIVTNPLVKTWLHVLDLEVHDAQALFRLLDDGAGEITYDKFLSGVLRLKGQARTMDIVSIMHSCEKTLEIVKAVDVRVDKLQCQLLQKIDTLPDPKSKESRLRHLH